MRNIALQTAPNHAESNTELQGGMPSRSSSFAASKPAYSHDQRPTSRASQMNSLSLLRRRTAPLAAAALLALALALAAAGGAAAAEENVIEFPLNQAIPGSQKLREVSQTSQSRNDLSKPSSPGRDPSTGLPNDVPADVAGSAAAADDTANASAPAAAAEGGRQKKKERIIGEARQSSWAERGGPWQPPLAC